jgi:uncharacterized protein involved in outer membrane biogenesis
MKRFLRVVLVVAVLLVVAGVAARLYLRSGHVASQVAARLQAAYGGPVRVASADVGLTGSTVGGLELFEKSKEGKLVSQQPWVTVQSVTADVSLLGVLSGNATPGKVTLTGAAVTLRFDEEGRLVTRLPEPPSEPGKETALPEIRVERSKITLQRDGGLALVVTGIDADLKREGDKLVLTGDATNPDRPDLGKWDVRGEVDNKSKQASVTLASTGAVHVTQELLNELPFVPQSVWREVQIVAADSPVTVRLRFDLAGKDIHYRVETEPQHAEVRVIAVELDAKDAKGKAVLEDGLVELRDVEGRAFGGTIRATGDLDFRRPKTHLHFPRVEVKGLVVRQLPKSWDVPRQIEGRLQGSAWADVTWVKGKMLVRGEGKGEIVDARVAGQPTAEPVKLELHAKEGGFGFRSPEDSPPQASEGHVLLAPLVLSAALLVQDPGPQETPLPARAVNGASATLGQLLQGVSQAGTELARFLPKQMDQINPKAKAPPGRSIDVNLKMQKVDLAKFVQGLGLKLPFEVGGKLSFQVKASIPLDTAGDLTTYRANGSAEVARLRLAGMEFDEIRGNVVYAGGVLTVADLTGRISGEKGPPGTFKGSARMQVVPVGELTADLAVDRIPLSRVAALAGAANQVQGDLSGTVTARAPGDKLGDVNAWQADAKLATRKVRAYGWAAQDSVARARLQEGRLLLPEVRSRVEGSPVTGSAELRLAVPYPFTGKVVLRGWDLSALQRLAPEVRPPVPVAGKFDTDVAVEGTLQPLSARTTGTASARNLRVAELALNDVSFAWKSDDDRLTLDKVHARLYDGSIDGQAVLPLRSEAGGRVELKLKAVDVGALAKSVPKMPFRIEGKANGTVTGTLPPAPAGKEREANVDVDLRAPRLKVQGIQTEQLAGTVSYHERTLDYRLEGKALGGTFELNGQVPTADEAPAKPGPEGRLRVQGARLSGLATAFRQNPDNFPLRGTLDMDVKFRQGKAGGLPVGGGKFLITRPRWGDTELADRIQGQLILERGEVRLREVTANVGRGTLRAQMALSLRRPGEGWFTLSLDGVETAALLAPFPDLAGKVQGRVEARLRGRLNHEWNGSGDLLLGRSKLFGVEVTDLRLPLTWSYSPDSGRGELSVCDASAQLASGRATGNATLGWGTGVRLDGGVRFTNVDLRSVSRQFADSSQFGSGRVTGRFDFSGSEMRSLNDLAGILQARLAENQAFQAPVLYQLAPYLGIQTSSSFDRGELRARLSRGVFRIEHLTLWGQSLRVMVIGTVTLTGRLDLDVTARTGSIGFDPARLAELGLTAPLPAVLPVTVLGRVSRYLSNRLIHLRVTGTVNSPNVRIEPLSLLTQEAVQFFLNQANVPFAVPLP